MAPLFGESEEMKQIGQQMQNLSEQIAALKQELAQKNTEVDSLKQQLGQAQSQSGSNEDTYKLQQAQNEINSLEQRIDMLQAQAKQASATFSASTVAAPESGPTSAQGLAVGGSAWVTRAGGLPLRLRSGPGLNANILDRLAPGTQMTLQAGPHEADGHAWWQIRTTDGRAGWVAGEDLRTQPD